VATHLSRLTDLINAIGADVKALTNASVTVDKLPPNSTITLTKSGGVWPGVPTTRTDIVIIWKGADPTVPAVSTRTLGQPGLLNNVDLRLVV
jgi:hypothetical protein